MRSDVPCAESARLALAAGFPIGSVWHGPGSAGMAATDCAELRGAAERWLRLNGFLLSNRTP